jgi:predicted porin
LENFEMKKTLIALAALAATGAFAQSTVALTGNVGFGFQSVSNAANFTVSGLTMTDATLAVTASEDLGGGMKATANMTFDTGGSQFNTAGNFNRRNTSLGLSGGFGSVSFANTRSGDLLTRAFVAPAALPDGIYDSSGILARAPIDIVSYTTPNFSGFTGSLSYVESGTAAVVTPGYALTQGDGGNKYTTTTTVLGLNYANGPLAAGLSFKSASYNSDYAVAAALIARSTNAEGFLTYDFGMARVGLGFDSANSGVVAGAVNDATAWSFGVAAPIGAFTVGVNWAQRDVNNMYEAVVKYDLSKRTAINVSFGRQSADAVAGGVDGNQYRVGLFHAF